MTSLAMSFPGYMSYIGLTKHNPPEAVQDFCVGETCQPKCPRSGCWRQQLGMVIAYLFSWCPIWFLLWPATYLQYYHALCSSIQKKINMIVWWICMAGYLVASNPNLGNFPYLVIRYPIWIPIENASAPSGVHVKTRLVWLDNLITNTPFLQ